jgi:Sec-independent protein secretion pathway component TatC
MRWRLLIAVIISLTSFGLLLYTWYFVCPNVNTLTLPPQSAPVCPDSDLSAIQPLPLALLLTFTFVGLSAGALPVAAYFSYRFAKPGWPKQDKTRLFRQAGWIGFLGALLAYLQLIRALNWTIAAVLITVFILIETFFLTRE